MNWEYCRLVRVFMSTRSLQFELADMSLPSDDVTNFATNEPIPSSEDSLFSSDIDPFPPVVAQSGPGSSLQFNDNPPNEEPSCKFPKHIRCCPIDLFTRCIFYNPGHPLCMSSRTLYCCQNIPVQNDEGDELGWDLQCDQDVILPSYEINIGEEILDFLRTDVRDWIPPIPFIGGDHQFGIP